MRFRSSTFTCSFLPTFLHPRARLRLRVHLHFRLRFGLFPNSVYALGFQSLIRAVSPSFGPKSAWRETGIPIAIPMGIWVIKKD